MNDEIILPECDAGITGYTMTFHALHLTIMTEDGERSYPIITEDEE